MNRKMLLLILCAVATVSVASMNWMPVSQTPVVSASVSDPESNGTCGDASAVTAQEPDPARVPPGCCTSNCVTSSDCDKLCGKGNCVCIATNSCCRRCTW